MTVAAYTDEDPFKVYIDEPEPGPDTRYCACGCGEVLTGTHFSYKRGHKLRSVAADTLDDPDPIADDGPTRSYTTRITKRMKDDMQGKVAFFADVLAQLWASKDPICGPVAQESVPAFSEALVPILCKSPEVVRYLTKGGNFSMVMDLLLTLVPLSKVLSQHHIFHSVGATETGDFDADIYRMPGA